MASKEQPYDLGNGSTCSMCQHRMCICEQRDPDGSWHPSRIDVVNSPQHYKIGNLNVEVVDVIEALLTPEEFRGWLKGNRIKYSLRAGKKDEESQDLEKECWFAKRLIEKNKQ